MICLLENHKDFKNFCSQFDPKSLWKVIFETHNIDNEIFDVFADYNNINSFYNIKMYDNENIYHILSGYRISYNR